ncbi:adenosylmethionine--8-amino-7-oxononanoate transaminase [Rhodothalassium salexigens]|uniref:adenosylmethionine--8-amino-7-oxononanoate transaminase n=1 Tax=Rhodothalassium salexigens TaxID=1086 RepID=UPI0019144ED7|nr:adenosylmethionine--8-amino-7-oxononanoate transaminase [Rhodothalassium salexigens]MBK5920149.1 adenosylmethionine--8-amino-7-oxononanoate transaminase [Rhodothalassium salexigens]
MWSPSDTPDWLRTGLDHLWFPYTQMKTMTPPLPAVETRGSEIVLADGRRLVDGVASWWTAAHGYNHPHILEAMTEQMARLPHVMFGGLMNEPAARLAGRLAAKLPGDLNRCFFAESGSVSVEVAMKMAVQYRLNRGEQRSKILCFEGGYHGDTIATMAVCDPEEGMHSRFAGLLPRHVVAPLPVDGERRGHVAALVEAHGHELAAILIEPLVQGAGGMRFHDAELLRFLRELADAHGLMLIFDEIFVGFGRTGALFACEKAGVVPDIVTLSKALTGGVAPLSACVATERVFEGFWSDDPEHALMHGPTYMAHALGCAAANASLDLFETEDRLAQAAAIEAQLAAELAPARDLPGVRDVRTLGAIGVVELDTPPDTERLRARFIDRGVWVRPFGSIVYLTPALTIAADDLSRLTGAIIAELRAG